MRFPNLYWDLNPTLGSSIFLAGVGRSGTTWLANLLNHRNQYRIIFEPFHPNRVPVASGFQYLQYLRPHAVRPDLKSAGKRILTGRVRHPWIDSENSKRISRRRLIKEIRSNLMLAWLRENFPQMPIILLLRHPCAVAKSWQELRWGVEDGGSRQDLEILLSQEDLVTDHLEPFLDLAGSVSEDFERHVLEWCILNYVPLKQFSEGDLHITFYEELCVNPKKELIRIQRFLGSDAVSFDWSVWAQPSSQSRENSAVVVGSSLIDTWKETVPAEWSSRAIEIVAEFGLDCIYSTDSRPSLQGLKLVNRQR